ncbi:MAG: hypothetical protein LBT09_05035 [Planctomycetaceae bacterium]|jgi:hypothetical protein|nr:hypothetical protein [Planctomycetaceae bacterium]
MFSFVLLPLGIYFAVFTFICCRRNPTFFNGGSDVAILLFGVFGLVSFGPGKLLIPMYVYNMWGVWAVLYWLMIYYLVSYCICNVCRNYAVIYNCDFDRVMGCISEVAGRLDRRFYIEERVLHLPVFGLHCVIGGCYYELLDKLRDKLRRKGKKVEEASESGKYRSGYIFVKLTGSRANDPAWELFQRELADACRNLPIGRRRLPVLYGLLAGVILVYFLANFTTDWQTLQNIFTDYWS